MRKQSRSLIFALSLAVVQQAPKVGAADDYDYKYGHRDGVPEYCDKELSEERRSYWSKKIGKNYGGLSHYCSALHSLHQLNSGFIREKKGEGAEKRAARGAIKGIRYWEARIPKDHWMLTEMHQAYAEAYGWLGDKRKEQEHRVKAISGSAAVAAPSGRSISASAQAYVSMADKMMELGIWEDAVDLYGLALRLHPDSKRIKAKLEQAKAAAASGGRVSGAAGRE